MTAATGGPPAAYADLWSRDRPRQRDAWAALMAATDTPVSWAAAVWDDLVAHLASPDNHDRAIAGQLLAGLAISEPDRILAGLPALLAVTNDPGFVTARHTLQGLWRVGLAGEEQRAALVRALVARFRDAAAEKHGSLIRYDIAEGLRKLHDATGDDTVRATALELIDEEADPKYRKKYARVWRTA